MAFMDAGDRQGKASSIPKLTYGGTLDAGYMGLNFSAVPRC